MTKTNSWDCPPRNSRLVSQPDMRVNQEHSNHMRDRSFDTPSQSQYLLHPFDHRSESLMNLQSTHFNQQQLSQLSGRFSHYDLNQMKLVNGSVAPHAARKPPKKSLYSRRSSERLSLKRRKSSLANPSARSRTDQKPHFIANRWKADQQSAPFSYTSISQSPSTITNSNFTRSTINTTASESSISTEKSIRLLQK